MLAAPVLAAGQDRRLSVRVEDPSGATIPRAHVIVLSGSELVAETSADASGLATVALGRATSVKVVASASGFDPGEIEATIPLPTLHSTAVVVLSLARVETDVLVVGTPEEAGSLNTALSPAELAELPDDPEEMQRLLEEIAGPGATFQVDGFRGGRLPPRDQIARVVIRRDAYSAEFHQIGQGRVDISTRPGLDRWRGNAGLTLRPSAWSAHNALARDAESGTLTRLSGFAGGPIVRKRLSFTAEVEGTGSEEIRGISALTPDGPRVEALIVPFDNRDVTVRTEGLLTERTLVRASYRRSAAERDNQGISELDLPERGYRREELEQWARLSIEGGVRRPYHARVQWEENTLETVPATRARTLVVQNAFRSGGAIIEGRDRERMFDLDTMVTLATRPVTLRAGAQATSIRYLQGQLRNTLGTYTFTDLTAYTLGLPSTFTQRQRAQVLAFHVGQSAVFTQAEFTRGSWSLGAGLRHEWQSSVSDGSAFAPRLGVSRSFRRDRTSLRAGYGWFYAWMPVRVVEESRRLGAESIEEEVIIRFPGYPDPFADGVREGHREPPTLLTLAAGASLPRWKRASAGVEHRLRDGLRLRSDVYHQRTNQDFRAVDLNAPIDRARPDPALGRVILVDSIGRVQQTGWNVELSANLGRVFANVRYSWMLMKNDADDVLTPPPDGRTFSTEWARARGDVPHRLTWNVGGPIGTWGLSASMYGRVQAGTPYTITTGFDDNADAVFSDRPDGVGRNTLRGDAIVSADLRLTWTVPSARPAEQRGPDGGRGGPGGRSNRRFETFLSVNNLFNTVNYGSYVGVLTSPYFERPTSALTARRLEVGWRIRF
jgi:hypothetical protein